MYAACFAASHCTASCSRRSCWCSLYFFGGGQLLHFLSVWVTSLSLSLLPAFPVWFPQILCWFGNKGCLKANQLYLSLWLPPLLGITYNELQMLSNWFLLCSHPAAAYQFCILNLGFWQHRLGSSFSIPLCLLYFQVLTTSLYRNKIPLSHHQT